MAVNEEQYIELLKSNITIKSLGEQGYLKFNEYGEIEFPHTNISGLEIHPLDLNPYEDGALIIEYDKRKYLYYLSSFGSVQKINRTVSMLDQLVRSILSDGVIELHTLGACSSLVVKGGENYKLESSSVYSKNYFNNLRWSLRHLLGSCTTSLR